VANAEAAGQNHLTIYSCRYGYAPRGTNLGLDHRTPSKLVGHDPQARLLSYGRWTDESNVGAAVGVALARRAELPSLCPGSGPFYKLYI